MSREPPASILVLKPSSLGDIIHTLPAVAKLKSAWPSTRIFWLANPEWVPLLEGNPDLDSVLVFPRRTFKGWSGWRRFYKWQRQHVRNLRPDLVLDFQGLLRSASIGRLSRPHIFYGLGDAREGARWFYDRSAPILPGVPHSVERYLALANFALGGEDGPLLYPPTGQLRTSLPQGEPIEAASAKRLEQSFVLLHPYSRGSGKSLTVEQVGAICRQLAPRQVVLVGRSAQARALLPPSAFDLLNGTTLGQLLWLMRRAAFVISVDSGPAHLAAALGTPLVAIHTWSDPRRVGPYRADAWVWKSGRLLQMRALHTQDPDFFKARPSVLTNAHIELICALVTSPSYSCA